MAEIGEPVVYNGMTLPYGNRRALQWAFLIGPRLDELKFHSAARLILMSLALHSDLAEGSNRCFPGMDLIARESGLHRSHVSETMQELESSGVVEIKRSGRSNHYRLRLEIDGHVWSTRRATRQIVSRDQSDHPTSDVGPHDVYRSDHPTSDVVSPDPKKYSQEEHREKGKEDEQLLTGWQADAKTPEQLEQELGKPAVESEADEQAEVVPVPTHNRPSPTHPARHTGPAVELAAEYFRLIGSPNREAQDAKTTWVPIFQDLIDQYGADRVKKGAEYADADRQPGGKGWAGQMARYTGSSAKWFAHNFAAIDRARQLRNAEPTQLRSAQSQSTPSGSPIISPECHLRF